MEIQNDKDLIKYMSRREMFTTKEIVNSDFKTSLTSNKVYYIDGIDIEWVSDDTVVCYIYSKNTTCAFNRTCSKDDFYKEMRNLFIPVAEMYEAWKLS